MSVDDANVGVSLRCRAAGSAAPTAGCSVTGVRHCRQECVTDVTKEGMLPFDLYCFYGPTNVQYTTLHSLNVNLSVRTNLKPT